MDFRELTDERVLFFDGAMGTMLQRRGLKSGELSELYNLTHPDIVTGIHKEYVLAGADVITANTFQAHELKLNGAFSVEDVVTAGIRCAKDAGARYIALDVGPLGHLLEPAGDLSFDRAYEIFRRQMMAGEVAGADFILIETFSDPYEAKAAILAAKENTCLPVVCSMTFQEDGRTFMGCDALTATMILQGLGTDALGVNCSLGPAMLEPVVETMLRYARVPVIMQANAGLPVLQNGQINYALSPEAYTDEVFAMVQRGVRIVGGCCGTTPEYIRLLRERIDGTKPVRLMSTLINACTSGTQTVIVDENTAIERLDPAVSEEIRQALLSGDTDSLIDEAIDMIDNGAQMLEVTAEVPGLPEAETLINSICALQSAVRAPLQIRSSNPDAMEAALRVYNGCPLIKPACENGENREHMAALAKKYGAHISDFS